MASQLQTSCCASWWTIGVCILAAALLPGEPLPVGPPQEAVGSAGALRGSGQPLRRATGCRRGEGLREGLRRGGEGWDRLFGVPVQVWSRCGSICGRVGENRGRFHPWLGEEQHPIVCFGSSCRQWAPESWELRRFVCFLDRAASSEA